MSSVYSGISNSTKKSRSSKPPTPRASAATAPSVHSLDSVSVASSGNARRASARASQANSYTSSQSAAHRIAEDLLRLLRSSAVVAAPTRSIQSTVSLQSQISNGFLSQVELAILRSTRPIEVTETEEITVLGNRGLWTNRSEVLGWTGKNFSRSFFVIKCKNVYLQFKPFGRL